MSDLKCSFDGTLYLGFIGFCVYPFLVRGDLQVHKRGNPGSEL